MQILINYTQSIRCFECTPKNKVERQNYWTLFIFIIFLADSLSESALFVFFSSEDEKQIQILVSMTHKSHKKMSYLKNYYSKALKTYQKN